MLSRKLMELPLCNDIILGRRRRLCRERAICGCYGGLGSCRGYHPAPVIAKPCQDMRQQGRQNGQQPGFPAKQRSSIRNAGSLRPRAILSQQATNADQTHESAACLEQA